MAISAEASLVRTRAVGDILKVSEPDKMSPEEAIEFYEEIITDLESYAEALKEENDLD